MIPEPQVFPEGKGGGKNQGGGDDDDEDDDGSVASSVAAPSTVASVHKSDVCAHQNML